MRTLLSCAALSLATAGAAAPTADSLIGQGQFAAAAAAARAVGDAGTAGKATLIGAAFQATTKEQAVGLLAQALAETEAAIARKPRDPDALLQRALIIGYRAKLKRDPGDAKDARKQMEAVTQLAPNHAFAWAALGGWHGDAIIDVGPMLAGMALGAKKDRATEDFDLALAKDPASPLYPTYYAIMLLRMDKKASSRAQALLQTAVGLRPRDGFETLMRARAAQLLVPLKAGNIDQARALAVQLAPFGRITAKI